MDRRCSARTSSLAQPIPNRCNPAAAPARWPTRARRRHRPRRKARFEHSWRPPVLRESTRVTGEAYNGRPSGQGSGLVRFVAAESELNPASKPLPPLLSFHGGDHPGVLEQVDGAAELRYFPGRVRRARIASILSGGVSMGGMYGEVGWGRSGRHWLGCWGATWPSARRRNGACSSEVRVVGLRLAIAGRVPRWGRKSRRRRRQSLAIPRGDHTRKAESGG